jgi:hypothetical protein
VPEGQKCQKASSLQGSALRRNLIKFLFFFLFLFGSRGGTQDLAHASIYRRTTPPASKVLPLSPGPSVALGSGKYMTPHHLTAGFLGSTTHPGRSPAGWRPLSQAVWLL